MVLRPRLTLRLKFIEIHSKIPVYVPSANNGKESWKMIQDPRKNPDRQQNLIDSFLGHAPPLHKISSTSVHNFWDLYFAYTHGHRERESDECITSSAEVNIISWNHRTQTRTWKLSLENFQTSAHMNSAKSSILSTTQDRGHQSTDKSNFNSSLLYSGQTRRPDR